MSDRIVIVGGGHAAAQLCAGLAEAGLGPRTDLVCAEPVLPYHRPPLSKAFLKSADEALQPLRPAAAYADKGITVHLGDAAVALDRAARRLTLASGRGLDYGHAVLATGARPRRLPALPAGLENLALLRSAADAQALRPRLQPGRALTVIGGGFIGLEVAATARALGLEVTLLEAAPRLLQRAVSPELAEFVRATHEAAGLRLRLGVAVGGFEVDGGRLLALQVDGERLPVDEVLLGIGAEPETALAEAAGLACDDGILVDAGQRSSDPAVLAVGDCCRFPAHALCGGPGPRLRLESVQNANDQARTALATLLGRDEPYRALPWFWSEQGGLRLQMAGLMPPAAAGASRHRRLGAGAAFSILHYVGEQLVCAESVNAPMDHMMLRKLLEAGRHPAPALACDPAVALKTLL